ncbi:MAG: hypothetical protein P0Y52_07945 [Candidatus Brevundimonas phytovorans]|nr:hypothetical protein [Brevundimonas sp.]WEK56490.1 MAG: hypothetical protein P0Y52_07945 [Brevundimonas sp.]
MAVLTLPTDPAPAKMAIGMVSAKNVLSPAMGGAEQELLRKGTRYALTFSMPVMTYVQSMDWDDLMAEGDTVLMRVFQPGLVIPNPGTPLVKGAGQAGTSLVIDGLPNGYVIRKGQFLSVVSAGQRFLYRAKASATSVAGTATIPLRTMLRRPPNDNDVVEIAQPMIEGFVRDLGEWAVGIERLVGLQFTVRERE